MKKVLGFFGLLLCAGVLRAEFDVRAVYNLDPSYTTATSVTKSSVTISAPGANQKICLTDWDFMSSTISNMVIIEGALNGGTTMWGLLSVPASTPVNRNETRQTALCAGANSQVVLSVSSGTVSINYRGYVRTAP